MAKKRVADVLVDTLVAADVKRVYGLRALVLPVALAAIAIPLSELVIGDIPNHGHSS